MIMNFITHSGSVISLGVNRGIPRAHADNTAHEGREVGRDRTPISEQTLKYLRPLTIKNGYYCIAFTENL